MRRAAWGVTLRFVSPSSPLVSTWHEPLGMAGSGSCAEMIRTSAGTAWWFVILMRSPTCRSEIGPGEIAARSDQESSALGTHSPSAPQGGS